MGRTLAGATTAIAAEATAEATAGAVAAPQAAVPLAVPPAVPLAAVRLPHRPAAKEPAPSIITVSPPHNLGVTR